MFANNSASEGIEMNSMLNELKIPPREECIYTACYCEENVWKLCEYVKKNQSQRLGQCYAVFISNRSKTVITSSEMYLKTKNASIWNDEYSVPLWCQKSGNLDTMCIWDYHVIFVYHSSDVSRTLVYDLDSTLPFPIHMRTYLERAVRSDLVMQPCYHREFRVIPAPEFLKLFASDRSIMRNEDGSWIKPPPPYPCITTEETSSNIMRFISMDPSIEIGQVMNLRIFIERFLMPRT